MRYFTAGLPMALLALSACGSGEGALTGEEKVAAVEAAQTPAPVMIELQSIGAPDMQAESITGPACAFRAQGSGLAALVIAQEESAFVKIDGELRELAADGGSSLGPLNTHSRYDGAMYSLAFLTDRTVPEGGPTDTYPTRITLADAYGQTVFERSGTAQCR